MRALIGSSGFVGRNLVLQWAFDLAVNSKTVGLLEGMALDVLVCAGAPAAKWIANADPAADAACIDRLSASLERIKTRQLVLISTIDVYPQTQGADESLALDEANAAHPYGRNRLLLEQRVRALHPGALIVRLPALFGASLRKNALFDLLNRHQLDRLNGAAAYQWYGLERLGADLDLALAQGLDLVNLFTEPLRLDELTKALFPALSLAADPARAALYDLKTRHAAAFGGRDGYIENRAQVVARMRRFVATAAA